MSSNDLYKSLMNKYNDSGETNSQEPPKSSSTGHEQTYQSLIDKYNPEIDDDYVKRFTDDVDSFFNKYGTDVGYVTGKNIYDQNSDTLDDLNTRARILSRYFENNAELYENPEQVVETIARITSDLKKYGIYLQDQQRYYSQFESENDYNWYEKYNGNNSDDLKAMMDDLEDGDEKTWLDAYTRQVYNDELKNLDVNAARAKVAGMEELLNTYRSNSRMVSDVNGQAWWEELRPKLLEYGGVEGLEQAISRENQRIQLATRFQEQIRNQSRFAGVEFRPDFAEKSVFDPANTEIGYRYINGDAWDRFLLEDQYGQYAEEFGYHAYDSLTDEEKAVYNYFMNTGDRESAADYLRYIQDPINQRKAQAVFEDGFKGHAGREFVYGWDAGLDQFRSGAAGFGAMIRGDTAQSTPSATQYASAMMREDLGENGKKLPAWLGGGTIGQAVYDSVTTTANMAPSILASTVIGLINPTAGAWVGSAMMGASAAGSAYQEMIDSGYSVSQARTYGSLVGAAEIVLDKILGGITKLGSGSSLASAITRWAGNVDSALINLVGRIGGNALSEGAEEALQEVFSGWLQSEVTKENFYAKPADVIYSGLLGAVTGALFESPDAGMDVYQRTSQGQNVIRSGGVQTLTDMGKASGNTDIRRMAERTARKPSAYNVGGLSRQVSSDIHSQNVADISKQLAGNGMKGKAADQMAEVIASVLENGSESDIRLLASETDPIVAKTMRQVQMKGTTLSQRMQQLRGATGKSRSITQVAASYGNQANAVKAAYIPGQDVDTFAHGFEQAHILGREGGKAEALEQVAPDLAASQRKIAYDMGRAAAAEEKAAVTKRMTGEASVVYRLNEDGSTGDAVRIEGVESTEGGKWTYRLSDGQTVSEDQLSFSGDQAVIDTVKELNLDAKTASVLISGNNTISKPDSAVAQAIEDAYRYGSHGYSMDRLLKDSEAAGILTEEMRQAAYDAGKNKPGKAKAKPSKAKPKTRGAKPGVYFDNGNGQVQAYDLKSTRQLEDTKKAGVQTAVVLQKLGIGTDFYFFESYVKDGKRVYRDEKGVERPAPNGWYDPNDGSIHIDLKAGNGGQGLTLYTMAHELTHFIEQWSQEKYKVLADFLIKTYEKGRSVDDLVHLKQEALSAERGKPVSYDEAYSEVIADSMEAMLSDGNVLDKLAELKQQDKGLVRKMKAFFDNFVKKIRSIYAELEPESAEGQLVQEMKDQFEQFQQLFAEALADAGDNYRNAATLDADMESNGNRQYHARFKNPPKTFKNSQNANGEFVANILIDLADSNSEWWTGVYNRAILGMSKSDDTEFRQFYQEILKRTKDMAEYGESPKMQINDSFVVQNGNGKGFIYHVKLDGYLHGTVVSKIDKKKHEAMLQKAMQGGKYGQSDVDLNRRIEDARNVMERNRSIDSRNFGPESKLEYGGMDPKPSKSHLGRFDERKDSDNRYVSDSERIGRQFSERRFSKAVADSIDRFGTTTDFEEAAFILPSGEMLKFTDSKNPGTRIYDHRAIGLVYGVKVDLSKNHGFNEESNVFLDEFVEEGGIRFDPGVLDMDMDAGMQLSGSVPITAEQERAIRNFIAWKKQREETYNPDNDPFSMYSGPLALHIEFGADSNLAVAQSAKDLDAWGVKHLSYEGGQINADRVIADIRHFYKTGEIRKPSLIAQFHYQDRASAPITNRALLANALESTTQDETELTRLREYRMSIDYLNEQEAKLTELRSQIREISFGKGPKDTARLKQLQEEATKTADLINKADKKLLRLEAAKPLQRVLERERGKAYRQAQDRNKEVLARRQEGRNKTVLRKKIQGTIRELDKIFSKGTKQRNVKQGMRDFVATALKSAEVLFADNYSNEDMVRSGVGVDLTSEENRLLHETQQLLTERDQLYSEDAVSQEMELTVSGDLGSYEQRMAQSEELDRQISRNMRKLKGVFERERNRLNSATVTELLNNLAAEYRKLGSSDDMYIRSVTDENVYQHLLSLAQNTEGTLVKDMSQDQLLALHKAFKMVLTTIRNANKAFVDGRSVEAEARQLVQELEAVKVPKKAAFRVLRNLGNAVGWNYEKLHYALERINSPALTRLFGNLADSENITMRDIREAKAFQMEMVEKYHYNDWDVEKRIDNTFLDNNGKEFRLTLGQLMALYAYTRRENTGKHIEFGGFKIGKAALTDPAPATTYKLTEDQCRTITDMLTADQKSFAEAMQKFLSETMGAKGNEVSMKLYGIEMFGEENYFPLHIAGEYKAQAQESQAKAKEGFQTMSNAGFTKSRNQNATAPIVLEDFMEVWVDHVNEMSRYHGAVPALEDIRRVMNYSVYSDATNESISVDAAMTNAYGKQAVEYFDNLYREANSGAITDKMDAVPKKLLSLFRKNAVAYSLSVVIQQPASIYRARALVDRKYFGKHGFFSLTGGVLRIVSRKKWNTAYDEMMKYAPGVTMAKEIGGFDTSTGSSIRGYLLDTEKSFAQSMKHDAPEKKLGSVLGLVDNNPIANLPEVADKLAWIEMWEACKRETIAKNPKLQAGSEEFFQKVGERFTEVIRATQVYDSMFSKSPMLKSTNLFVQSMVSFMNEPNTVANMAEAVVRDLTRGKPGKAAKTAGALVISIAVTNILKSLVYALRDDDEDKDYTEKYISAVAGNLMSDVNILNYIPFVRDAVSVYQGYDVERSDMAIVSDAINAIRKLSELAGQDLTGMSESELEEWDKACDEAKWRVAETLSPLFGIPLKNIRRDVLAVVNTVKAAGTVQRTRTGVKYALQEGFGGDAPGNDMQLYYARRDGDTEHEARVRAGYEDEDDANAAVRSAIRELYMDGEIDLKTARNHLVTYAGMKVDEAHWQMDEWKYRKEHGSDEGYGKYNALYEAVRTGEDLEGVIKTYIDNGEKISTLRSQITETFKNEYIEASGSEREVLYEKLMAAYQACGMYKEDVEDKLWEWEFEAEYGFAWSDRKQVYLNEDVSISEMRDIMIDLGMDAEEVEDDLKKWEFELEHGFAWSDRKKAYYNGVITGPELQQMLIDFDNIEPDDAAAQVEAYDWEAEGLEGATPTRVKEYNLYCKSTRLSRETYLAVMVFSDKTENDVDEEGNTIKYSAVEKIMAEMGRLGLTLEQKEAMALCFGWGKSTIKHITRNNLW